MNVANQQKSSAAMQHGSPTWAAMAVGAVLLVVLSAAITWITFATLAPQAGSSAELTAVGQGPTNTGLVEFRRGERGFEPVLVWTSNSALDEFRHGEQGGSAGAVNVNANPDPALVEFRRGERGG
jgi:hypothetical protein